MPVAELGPEHLELLAEIGKGTLAAGAADTALTYVLGALLAPQSSAGFVAELSSVFIYSARSVDQRIEMINGVFQARFHRDLEAPRHDNRRRAIEYLWAMLANLTTSLRGNMWARNHAAHGMVDLSRDQATVRHGLYDYQSGKRLAKKGYQDGLTAAQLAQETTKLHQDVDRVMRFAIALSKFIQWFHFDHNLFLIEINDLAANMKVKLLVLHDHSKGPPLRKKRI